MKVVFWVPPCPVLSRFYGKLRVKCPVLSRFGIGIFSTYFWSYGRSIRAWGYRIRDKCSAIYMNHAHIGDQPNQIRSCSTNIPFLSSGTHGSKEFGRFKIHYWNQKLTLANRYHQIHPQNRWTQALPLSQAPHHHDGLGDGQPQSVQPWWHVILAGIWTERDPRRVRSTVKNPLYIETQAWRPSWPGYVCVAFRSGPPA